MANMEFTTLDSLKNHLLGRTRIALDETIEEIKDELMKIIEERVYNNSVSGDYDRSYALLNKDAWKTSDVSHSGTISFSLEFNDAKWYTDGWKHIHGLTWYDGDRDTTLPTANDFINVLNENVGDAFTHTVENSIGFWDDFVDWVQGHFDEILVKHLIEQGIEVLY